MLIQRINLLLACILFCRTVTVNAQTLETITDLSNKHQICLDSGTHMLYCSRRYYTEMDSMLNLVYRNLRTRLSEKRKTELKTEQIKWLHKRDEDHKHTVKTYEKYVKSGEWGPEMYLMIYYDHDAEFIRKRVVELINRLNTTGVNK